MPSAANRAANILKGASRNRPSRSMSQRSGLHSSANSGVDDSGGGGSGSGSTPSDPAGANNTGAGGGGGGAPSFMQHVESQYESLSEKLAKEDKSGGSTTAQSTIGSSSGDAKSKKNKISRKVRWAETAAIASTMDGNSNSGDDDPDYYPKSPMDVLSDLFTKKYTLPVFLLLTTAIFLLVHLAGGGPNDGSFQRYGAPGGQQVGSGGPEDGQVGKKGRGVGSNRQQNVGGGDGFGDLIFSLTPTDFDSSAVPTSVVMHHTTPKVSPLSGATPSSVDGNEPGWIVVPTQSGVFGLADDANANNGDGNNDGGGPTTLKWGYGEGAPTPDPAYLVSNPDLASSSKGGPDAGSPTTLKWGYGAGFPTPDPVLLGGPDKGSPTTLVWNYPPGVPTPNPALLIEVAPPRDNGSPTTLKWSGVNVQPPTTPAPAPRPVPTTDVNLGNGHDAGSFTTLKWDYPPGEPTPDPALLAGIPDMMVWGYPPGVPTPDPVLLQGAPDIPTMLWGYPPGVPTPDPVLLSGGHTQAHGEAIGWSFPLGEPTPDPAFLNGNPPTTEVPTKRNVETGLVPPTSKPTPRPSPGPTGTPITNAPAVSLKMVDLMPETPRPAPDAAPRPKRPNEGRPTGSPIIPPPAVDGNGNTVELSPPEPTNPVPRPPRPQRAPRPKVNTQPYSGPGGFTVDRGPGNGGPGMGINPDNNYNDPWYSGPNGLTLPGQGQGYYDPNLPNQFGQPQIPNQMTYPGVVMPQMQSSCGCCCCHCGGGSMVVGGQAGGMVLPYTGQNYIQHVAQGGQLLPMQQLPGGQMMMMGAMVAPGTVAPNDPGCPWDCLIDETVPTMGRSHEDDALYEIFYTNPLHCCGTIVEVGAEDGNQYSTSYFFEKGMNWTTILTEANPTKFNKMLANRGEGKKATTIQGGFCKEGPFLYFDEASSTFKSPNAEDYSSEILNAELEIPDSITTVDSNSTVNCIRLDDILKNITHVNVMIVRVKGDPWAVIRTMDWSIQVDIWVILTEEKEGVYHDPMRTTLKLHDYVQAAWDIKLWCDAPGEDCVENEVWLRKNFNPVHSPLLLASQHRGLRGTTDNGNLLT